MLPLGLDDLINMPVNYDEEVGPFDEDMDFSSKNRAFSWFCKVASKMFHFSFVRAPPDLDPNFSAAVALMVLIGCFALIGMGAILRVRTVF